LCLTRRRTILSPEDLRFPSLVQFEPHSYHSRTLFVASLKSRPLNPTRPTNHPAVDTENIESRDGLSASFSFRVASSNTPNLKERLEASAWVSHQQPSPAFFNAAFVAPQAYFSPLGL